MGNADQILREKFGDKVIIKNFEKPKGFIARKLSSSIHDPVDRLTNIIEENRCGKNLVYKCQQEKSKKKLPEKLNFLSFQDIIMNLQKFWEKTDVLFCNLMIWKLEQEHFILQQH